MFFWTCTTAALFGWLLIGSVIVLFVYALHWAVTLLAILAIIWLLRNIRARR